MFKNTSFLTNITSKNSKYHFLSLFCITMLITVVILPSITIHKPSLIYAQTPLALKTLEVTATLSNKLLERGSTEFLKVIVIDQQNHQPVSGALVKVIIEYPGGKTTKQMALITDSDGQAFFIIPTRENDFFGSYIIEIVAQLTGYNDVFFSNSFSTANIPSLPVNNVNSSILNARINNVTVGDQGVLINKDARINNVTAGDQGINVNNFGTSNQGVRINDVRSSALGVPLF
jgi:hypothetical protein